MPGIFSAIAGPLIGSATQSIFGRLAGGQRDRGADAAMAAGGARNIAGPIGGFDAGSGRVILSAQFQNLMDQLKVERQQTFGLLNRPNFIEDEVGRLRELAAPFEAAREASTRSRLFNSGRLARARGGGRTGALFNPETAALEEALLQADLERVGAARNEEQRLLGNALALSQGELNVNDAAMNLARIGTGSALSPALAALAAGGANTRASSLLGSGLGLSRGLSEALSGFLRERDQRQSAGALGLPDFGAIGGAPF